MPQHGYGKKVGGVTAVGGSQGARYDQGNPTPPIGTSPVGPANVKSSSIVGREQTASDKVGNLGKLAVGGGKS